jgi:TetR/AcrR family transcriptional repressor of nem operon
LYNFVYFARAIAKSGSFEPGGGETNPIMGRTSDAREKLLAVAFDLIHEASYGTVSVEQICERAGVNKGSFYYFFKTKTDLVVAAYEEHWRIKQPDYERIFSDTNPPLRRLELWCEYVREVQKKRRSKYGHACGCPYTSLGGELATRDAKVRRKAQDLIKRHVNYLAGAIEAAQRDGAAEPGNAQTKAELVHSFIIGLLLRAKIYNDLGILRHAEQAVAALIGAKR